MTCVSHACVNAKKNGMRRRIEFDRVIRTYLQVVTTVTTNSRLVTNTLPQYCTLTYVLLYCTAATTKCAVLVVVAILVLLLVSSSSSSSSIEQNWYYY